MFELANSSGNYTEGLLYSFTGAGDGGAPSGGLVRDSSDNLYGTTKGGGYTTGPSGGGTQSACPSGCGTVFEVKFPIATFSSANVSFPSAILDQTSTSQTLTLTNTGTAPLILTGAFVTPDNQGGGLGGGPNMAAFGYSSTNITCNGTAVTFVPYETPLAINPNVSCIFPLIFDPSDENLSEGTPGGVPPPVGQSDTIIFDDNAVSSNAPNMPCSSTCIGGAQTITVSGNYSYGAKVQLSASASAADVGTPVTFTAIVTPLSSYTPGASPTGTVTFLYGQGSLGVPTVTVRAGG